jgi:L-iditol 2-dehydrogenase
VRALVVDGEGRPRLEDVPEPAPDGGEIVRVRACGLCGSDIEKLAPAAAGLVLGHEVVAETAEGRRVALVHHLPCGECERCRAGHESTCDAFRAATIVPGGFAERVSVRGGYVELPDEVDDATATFAEPLACVLRAAERVPPGDVLVVGGGFVGRLFAAVLGRRGERVYVHDRDPARSGPEPPGRVRAVVHTAPAGGDAALERVEPGGFVLVFADAGELDLGPVYRNEITVAGSRSATPRHLVEAVTLLPELELPPAEVLPLERFDEGLARYRSRRAYKVVFTP